LFPGFFRKPVVARFDQREGSSDGGALLLKAADRQYGLVAGLASCLRDERQAVKVDHSLRELVAQPVFSIACGDPDANDAARLSRDPIHKLLLERDPIKGRDLASQPTLSCFENGVGVKELYCWGEFLAGSALRRHGKRLRHPAYCVTIARSDRHSRASTGCRSRPTGGKMADSISANPWQVNTRRHSTAHELRALPCR
jgi:hypothetical protein